MWSVRLQIRYLISGDLCEPELGQAQRKDSIDDPVDRSRGDRAGIWVGYRVVTIQKASEWMVPRVGVADYVKYCFARCIW